MTIIVFVLLSILLYVLLSILIVRPVRSLHSYINQIEKNVSLLEDGKSPAFPALAVSRRQDEIAELFRGLNHLIERLNTANVKLIEMHHRELEHADRLAATGEMAAGIAHEIKNPIAGVLGALQVFRGETNLDQTHKDIMDEMMVQLERVNHAVNDLLQYARPTPPMMEKIDVRDILEKTASILSQQAKEKNISINKMYGKESLVVPADKKQIQQAFWNVILNAIQAVDAQGVVTIDAKMDDNVLLISISDNGKGIPPEQVDQVFKPFFTTKHKGTGLGMTITKRIIEQHQGSLHVKSAVGSGTTVTIRLPKEKEGHQA
jgi:hypothetical protein